METPPPAEARLFIAIELPAAWREILAGVQAELRRTLPGLRYVRAEGIHLTLTFLGNMSLASLPLITDAIDQSVREIPAFSVRLGTVGTFGSRTRPRVVWVGVDGDGEAVRYLHTSINASLSARGLLDRGGHPWSAQRFRPHLTLARVPDALPTADGGRAISAVQSLAVPSTPPLLVTSVSLIRSYLERSGARYNTLHISPLREP